MTACPHGRPDGEWCPSCQTFTPIHRCRTFVAAALAITVAGCANLPATAYLVTPDELARVHDAWVRSGQAPCLPLPPLYVFEAEPDERAEWCDATPPPGACLAHARTSPMRRVWLAVVSPEYPAGWRHEAFHMFEACVHGIHDYGHAGPQWSRPARDDAGIP